MRLIDADAILCKMESVMDMQDAYLPVHFMEMVIEEMPTIEAELVKHGRWITSEVTIDSGCTSCSCCHSEYYIGDLQTLEGNNDFVMFCPNCGAKMEDNENEFNH